MLIEITEGEWILASEVLQVSYHIVESTDIWIVLTKIRGCEYSRQFKTEKEARDYCLNLVDKINGCK